jgi:Ca2+-transporting ATPase
MWASEPVPFDPMEKRYTKVSENNNKWHAQTIFHDSWISSRRKPPMMTHVFENKEGKLLLQRRSRNDYKVSTSVRRNSNKFKIQLAY